MPACRRAINSMPCLVQSSIGACTDERQRYLDASILFTLLAVASIGSIYFAGRIAERRGRRFKIWAWMAVIIGPLASVQQADMVLDQVLRSGVTGARIVVE